jgi:hypothetical protein
MRPNQIVKKRKGRREEKKKGPQPLKASQKDPKTDRIAGCISGVIGR